VDNYLNKNHWVDAVTSLEAAQELSSRVTLNGTYWKWALIAIHSGVQGFMVLALEHGNALLAMKNDTAAKWLKAYNSGTPYPE
jgi:regulation of enolase protein 1 (concanavalin A-like superfamily)